MDVAASCRKLEVFVSLRIPWDQSPGEDVRVCRAARSQPEPRRAVQQNGYALTYAMPELRGDREIVAAAIERTGWRWGEETAYGFLISIIWPAGHTHTYIYIYIHTFVYSQTFPHFEAGVATVHGKPRCLNSRWFPLPRSHRGHDL